MLSCLSGRVVRIEGGAEGGSVEGVGQGVCVKSGGQRGRERQTVCPERGGVGGGERASERERGSEGARERGTEGGGREGGREGERRGGGCRWFAYFDYDQSGTLEKATLLALL